MGDATDTLGPSLNLSNHRVEYGAVELQSGSDARLVSDHGRM